MNSKRCGWVTSDTSYIAYHDTEWGIPQRQNQVLFGMLCLEAQQSGLSWITVLKKRAHYQQRFYYFDPQAIALMGSEQVEMLMQDSGIIRHRGKIQAIITNARAYLAMVARREDFSGFIWSFVNGQQQVNRWWCQDEIPATTPVSDAMSHALKRRGFKFIGPTVCYAFMQASGLVNDHLVSCFCHPDNVVG